MRKKGESTKYFVALSIALIFVTLSFGLWPRGYDFSNHVTWLSSRPGIRFNGYGIAYTDPIQEWNSAVGGEAGGFSIELALRPQDFHDAGFNIVLAVHNGDDQSQLVVGQWRSWLIVMNGDDYDHRRKSKRVAIKIAKTPSKYLFVTITTGRKGTRIYLDGRLIRSEGNLVLSIPKGQKTRLFLGNSPDGKQSWRGDILGLAWYDYVLSDEEVVTRFREWGQSGSFLFAEKYKPFLLYPFDDKKGKRAPDQTIGKHDLKIPAKMVVLDKKILSLRRRSSNIDPGFVEDVLVNFLGFIPLGFVLVTTFVKATGFVLKRHILMAVSICFGVSLIIEILQAWIPSRSSDFLDLVLNALGGLVGAETYAWHYRRRKGEEAGKRMS